MDDPIDWTLLERYCAGDCTPEERAAFDAWIDAAPGRRAYVESVQSLWSGVASQRALFDTASAWGRMAMRVSGAPAVAVDRTRVARRSTIRIPAVAKGHSVQIVGTAMAAALLIAAAWSIGRRSPVAQQFREFTTAPGNRSTVTLRDGTRLVLGPDSRIRVPADFGIRTRTVDLDGKAYFAVVHDATRPFAVQTARAVIRDVGTTFVVHAYADDPAERVAVAEGEVAVQGTGGDASRLRANGVGTIDAQGRVVVLAHAVVSSDLAWVQGGLAFDNTPVRDVVRELARTFDLDIVVADSALLTQHVTASFGQEPVDRILAAVVLPLGARVERDGRRVVIRRGSVSAGQPAMPVPGVHEVYTTRVPPSHE